MSGRGCTIIIKVLGGSSGVGEVEEISLPVALHSPLQVLKEQLMGIVGIPLPAQVLILCDLTDPDRNSDVLLTGREGSTLRSCGIRNGSTLTLHALGISAEQKQKLAKNALLNKVEKEDPNAPPKIILATPITAAEANHSYNGVIFDVESYGPYEVDIHSISVAGMLGRVRVYARDRPWENSNPRTGPSPHWWAHQESVSPEGWSLVADKTCWPSWDKPVEIRFHTIVKLLPHTCRALYCHSGLPDDLGIQYQSYQKSDVVAADEHLTIRPGLGHTGAQPFDDQHGWYRAYRALAGSLSYSVKLKGWSPLEHKIFPAPLKEAVKSLLLCQNHEQYMAEKEEQKSKLIQDTSYGSSNSSSSSSSSNKRSGSAVREPPSDEPVLKISARDPSYVPPFQSQLQQQEQSAQPVTQQPGTREPISNPAGALVPISSNSHGSSIHGTGGRSHTAATAVQTVVQQACQRYCISHLPVFVLYNILEYMNWDWFEERYESERDATPCCPGAHPATRCSRRQQQGSSVVSPSQSDVSSAGGLYHILQQMGYQLTGAHAPGGDTYLHQLLYQHGAGIGINGVGAEEMYEEGSSEGDDSEYDFEEEEHDWDVQGEDTGSGSEGFSDDMSEDEGEIEAEGVGGMELQMGDDQMSVVMESEQEREDGNEEREIDHDADNISNNSNSNSDFNSDNSSSNSFYSNSDSS